MRLINIHLKNSSESVIVNTAHIVSVYMDSGDVLMSLSDGRVLRTQFEDVDHAVDYSQRASSHSLGAAV